MKATETTILKFIGGLDKAFIIPPFQRNYAWGDEQCTELFNDIIESCKTGKPHYLGNIIYYEGVNDGASYNEIVLVDGQQRVTTVLILLCAIRDSINEQSKKDSINKRYLLNDDGEDIYRIRLKQTAYDSNSFISMIDGTEPEDTNNNVTLNYNLFIKLLKECEIDPITIYDTIPKLEVVEVNLKEDNKLESVQKVFEKINSTGKPLTPADLIRNLLLLTDSTSEQERLYNRYWIKIEETLQSDNISRFTRDYLIMKIFDDVPEKQIYKLFKDYFKDTHSQNEVILDEMSKHSKYYSWLRFEKCPDNKINRCIKMLNILKTDDVYPLYLYLLFSMYTDQIIELRKIFSLLTDFLLRYRIVAPSGGGGALRSVVQELLENLNGGTVELTYEAILYELSNSATPAGRFPNDDEFKMRLMENVSTSYARVLLLRTEECETENIPVDISAVTIEHLMPQTLSDWWKRYLGGEEAASEIHAEYLNCIGNLTPVSQGYNSSMSNKPWSEKLASLSNVQFTITSEIADVYLEWRKDNIISRNNIIAIRAMRAIASPLERTRPYRSKNVEDYSPGKYPIDDLSVPMNGSTPVALHFAGNVMKFSRWKELLVLICSELMNKNEQQFNEIVANNVVHKATSKKAYPNKDPILSINEAHFVEPAVIPNSTYFCEGRISSAMARTYAKQLLELYDCRDEVYIEII